MKELDKRDWVNIFIIIASFFVFLVLIFLNGNGVYVSSIDFSSQHYMIPEYLRELFYNTGDLFPSYAFNLGEGQNIYNFSYYGLLNPIILLSYLLPFIKMIYYLNGIIAIIIVISIILFYKFISSYTDNKNIRLISGLLFLLSSPIIYHTHRHIMFIGYIPFVLMGLFGVEKYVRSSKKTLLIISTFLVIMTSYFFAIPAIIAFIVYGVFLFLRNNPNIKIKELFIKTFKLGLVFIIPILMSGVLLLPTFSAILNSRFEEKGIEIIKMLIPDLSFNNILYSHYALGLTSIFILAISYFLIRKSHDYRFLAIVFLVMTFFPFINYVLNGMMYVNGKVFIPFIPLGILLITSLLNNFVESKIDCKKLIIVFTIISILGCVNFNFDKILEITPLFYAIDFSILLIVLFVYLHKRNDKLLYALLAFPIFSLLIINFSDNLESKSVVDNQYDSGLKEEVINLNNSDSNLYRTLDHSKGYHNANNIRDISEYKNTMYSSLTNKNFKQFTWNEFSKENPCRNDAIYTDNSNVLYDIYTGSKYYITSENKNILGYDKVSDFGYKAYKNNDVFSIGYVNKNYMSLDYYNTLKYPYNVEALMNYTIVKDGVLSHKTNIKEIHLDKTSYDISNKRETKYKYKTKGYSNQILIIKFNMDYVENCKVGDTYIKINGVSNLLTCKGWKYHNKNYTFEYVISDKNIKDLDIVMSKGTFHISNVKAYTLDYNYVKDLNKNHDNLLIDKNKTKGDVISGKINVSNPGYLSLSIPYDKGYTIYVDNKKVPSEVVNKYFLGFKIDKGYHNVKIIYKAPLLNYGKVLSLIGIFIFIFVIIFDKKRRNRS